MGGIMKGGYGQMHAGYSSRRRWINVYVVMVIVCLMFGCGVLGLMGLYRLKERRILNLIIKEKHDQILSLNHLLQKEREDVQEAKKKTEEMKMKIFNQRDQKSELNSRVLDMQSTISSLRDEQRTIELAFQEKQNEAKILREQYMEIKDQNLQVEALTQVLQQKEAEIQDLKHRLQLNDAKFGSMSMDEHSIRPPNTTAKASISGSETMIDENNRETESSMQTEEHRENGRSINGRSEAISKEEFKRWENSQERSDNGRFDSEGGNEDVGRTVTGIKKNENREQKPRDDSKGFSTMGDAHSRRKSMSRRSDNQDLEVHKGLVKLEIQANSNNGHYRLGGKQGHLKQAKGKRRPIAKQTEERSSESNGASAMGDGMEEIKDKTQNSMRIQTNNQQFELDDKLPDAVQGEAMLKAKGYTKEDSSKPEQDIEGTSHEVAKFDDLNKHERGWVVILTNSSSEKSHVSVDELSKEQEIISVTEQAENNDNIHDHRLEQEEVAERNEDPDGIQMEHLELGEDSGDEEQADEPEF